MIMKNIFLCDGIKGRFIGILYRLLMTRKDVSYKDVYQNYKPSVNDDYLKRHSLSNEEHYRKLVKAFLNVKNALEAYEPGCVVESKYGKGKAFRYIGKSDDPFFEEKQVFVKNTLQDYVRFCKMSSGIFPMEWVSHFFENTQLLLDMKRDKDAGIIHLETHMEQELRGIERLPKLNEHITEQHVISFVYHPYGKAPKEVIIHPHFLKEYNGRWFLFGFMNKRATVTNYALDRIETEPQIVDGIEYVAAPAGTYKDYFTDIVGVSHEKDAIGAEPVIIRTQSLYMHELMRSKKLHHSQKETKEFGEHDDGTYGEFELYVEHNRELRGKILTYGEGLKVMAPDSLVKKLKDSVEALYSYYT